MPKIPTYTAKGTITGEAAAQPINVQAPLSMAKTLEPIQKLVTDYAVKERIIQDKTEALKLENDSIIELNGVVQEASRMMNKKQANDYLRNQSSLIRNKYRNQATSSSVQKLFENSYLMEEQKQIYKVDNAVYKNILQNHANEKSRKYESIITEGLFGDNPLQEKNLYNDLVRLENEDLTQDEDTRANNIAMIPFKIDYFKGKKAISDNPIQALKDLKAGKEGPYVNLTLDSRTSLISEATTLARPVMRNQAGDHLARLEAGLTSEIDYKAIQEVLGSEYYDTFVETETGILRTRDYKQQINLSKIGDENKIIDSFEIRPEASELDLKLIKQLQDTASNKMKLLKEDPATLIINTNSVIKDLYSSFSEETDETLKAEKFKTYNNAIKQAQLDMGLYSDQIKIIPNVQASNYVSQYNRITDPQQKIDFLTGIENEFGENYSTVLMQMSEQGLPVTAKLVSYLGNRQFALESLSIDSKQEKDALDNFLKTTDETKSSVMKQVANDLADFRSVVFQGNPFHTSKANAEFDNITNVMTYLTINKMSAGKDLTTASREATKTLTDNFQIEDSYFIPRIYNNQSLPDTQVNFIAQKADKIKNEYLDALDVMDFKSTDPKVTDEELNSAMQEQLRSNSLWLNKADGSGIFLAIKFANGEYGEVLMKDNQRIEINFDDQSFKIPGTDIRMDFSTKMTDFSGGA